MLNMMKEVHELNDSLQVNNVIPLDKNEKILSENKLSRDFRAKYREILERRIRWLELSQDNLETV